MALTLRFNDEFMTRSPDPKVVIPPKATVVYEFNVDAELKTDEGKELMALISTEFRKRMDAWKKEQEKKFDEAMKWTVENYNKKRQAAEKTNEVKKFTAEMESFAGTASIMLKKGIEAMLSQVDATSDAMAKKAIEAVNKKLKRKIFIKKVWAVAKIVVFSGIILAAAALSITATVLTGGAGAPLIVGALIVGLKATQQIVQTASKAWPSRSKAMAVLSDALDKYTKAYAYELKKQEDETLRSLGPKERIKRALNSVSGARKDVIVAVKEFENWSKAVKSSIESLAQKADGLSEDVMKLGKAGAELVKTKEFQEMSKAEKQMTVALKRLRTENAEIDGILADAKAAVLAEVPDQGKITGLIGKMKSVANSQAFKDVVEGIKLLGGGVTPLRKVVAA